MLMKDDFEVGSGVSPLGGYAWAAAKVTGTSHRARNIGSEDALAVATYTDASGTAWVIAAIADGAGSSKFAAKASHMAATHTVAAALEYLGRGKTRSLDTLLMSSAAYARAMILFEAEACNHFADDYLTTLLVCISNGNQTAAFQIGDGGIAVRDFKPDGTHVWTLLFEPQHGEFANQSRFLTEVDAFNWAKSFVVRKPLGFVALFSDGLESILIDDATLNVHAPLFEAVCNTLTQAAPGEMQSLSRDLSEVLETPEFRASTSDDMTMAVLRLTPE